MVINAKMKYFRCKARLVIGGHMTKDKTITHASIILKDLFGIALMIAVLSDMRLSQVTV